MSADSLLPWPVHSASAFLVVLTLLLGSAVGAPAPRKSVPLTHPYLLHRDAVLVANGVATAVVARPEGQAYAPLADEFVNRYEHLTRLRLPILPESQASHAAGRPRTVVVFGNSATGPVSMRLYANHLIGSDALYPGANGYELRTIPNAMDLGVTIVFLGGSSPKAARAAMDALFEKLASGDPGTVSYIQKWVSPEMKPFRPITEADIEREVQHARNTLQAFRSEPYRAVCDQFSRAATRYYLSGDDSYGRLCARLLSLMSNAWDSQKPAPPTFVMARLVMAMDQVEESRGMSDEDRLRGAELLRKITEATMGYWEMRGPIRRYEQNILGPVWNHETYPSLGVALAAQYLKARFDIPAADDWEAVVDHLFQGQVTCDQPLEDSANYQWLVPLHTITYVLTTGRHMEYFTNGSLRAALEYAIASHGPAGNEATHGDAWQPFGSVAAPLFRAGATLYKDPRYAWMLDRMGAEAKGMWQYPTSLKPRVPVNHVGLRIFTVQPVRADAYGIQGIPPNRVLDKAVFRSGWDLNADYMMLDGLNVGNHKHIDGNAIIRFSTDGRYWLVDMDYIRAAPSHHNSIVIVRDGIGPDISPASHNDAQVIGAPPFAAELVCSAGTRTEALTQSRMRDDDGLDWDRYIFWTAKNFLVVVDRLRAQQPGHYLTRAVWRTLGDASLDGNTLHVRQRGGDGTSSAAEDVHFYIVDADGARLKLRETFDYGHGGRDGYYAHYPYADKMTRVLTEAKEADLKTGDRLTYANLFYVRKKEAQWKLRPVGKNAWLISGEAPALVGVGPVDLDGLRLKSGMFLLTKDGLLTAGGDSVAQPANPDVLLARLARLATPAPPQVAFPLPQVPAVPAIWTYRPDSTVTALASGAGALFAGTRDGNVIRLDANGRVQWEKSEGARIRSLAWTNRNTVLVGTDAGEVMALDADSGRTVWSYACDPFHGRTGSVGVVFPADLDGDGKQEAVAGSDDWHYHAFSADGRLLWRTETTHASTVGSAGDYDGDGRDDILAGTEYYWPSVLDPSGKKIAGFSGGPVTTATAMVDLDGDGRDEALFGMEDGFVRCYRWRHQLVWKVNVGGAATALVPFDVDGDGRPEILCASKSFSVYALRPNGTQAWRTELTDAVNSLAVVGDAIVVGCDDSRAYILDRSGTVTGSVELTAPVQRVVAFGKGLAGIAAGPSVVAVRPAPSPARH